MSLKEIKSPGQEWPDARLSISLFLLLLAMTLVGLLDLILDGPEVWTRPHAFLEVMFLILSLGSAVFLWKGWRGANTSLARTRDDLKTHQSERDAWRTQALTYLQGLGEAIAIQFRAWALTPAESESALFLLKGFSHKEIGKFTGKSERTVRQHAIAVYRKSGIPGRAALSAFFLEDLLLPTATGSLPDPSPGRQAGSGQSP